ncbi:protein lifeguard 1 [Stegostoma tigrinum]|uniref:protein lifeguard 1 n=1 Tax=Stegostoma tigrinum TaxID=3053191 RepID=UPI00202B9D8A|nr:protein lifeguard 1 [Stegostoma tigrinum]
MEKIPRVKMGENGTQVYGVYPYPPTHSRDPGSQLGHSQASHQQDYPPGYLSQEYPAPRYPPQEYSWPGGHPANEPYQGSTGASPQSFVDAPPEYQNEFANETAKNFSEKVIRRAFIRKVYLILVVQLLITIGIICMFLYWRTLNVWVNQTYWFTYALFPAIFILIIILSCCDGVRRKAPWNIMLLLLFTILEGLLLGAVSVFYGADAVMWAVGATVFVSLGLTLFSLQTKWDFTAKSGVLFVVLLVLVAFGILCAIIQSFWLQIIYASLGTLIFSIYLVVDTQLMLGGKHRYSLSPEEYIFAALNLYLDIINLFLFILQIIGLSR